MQIIMIESETGEEETSFTMIYSWKLHSRQIYFFQEMLTLCLYKCLTRLRNGDVVHQVNHCVIEESLVRYACLNSVEKKRDEAFWIPYV